MPSFKGKDGQSRFHPNPQVARSMGSDQTVADPATAMGADPAAQMPDQDVGGDFIEIHAGESPDGQPPPDGTHTHHTVIHKKAAMGDTSMGMGPSDTAEIHNHQSYDDAEADARSNMEPGDADGDSDEDVDSSIPGDGSDEG